jgi:glycosyltransferase involved in cell wall biosynthesis
LFFTRGLSLREWDRSGLLERETALYRHLIERGIDVTFVTYGGPDDRAYETALGGIRVHCNRWGLPEGFYRRLLPMLHAPALARADVVKSNQIAGADVAAQSARWWRKPFVARCGYLLSDYLAWQDGPAAATTERARNGENGVFRTATAIVVSSEGAAEDVRRRGVGVEDRVAVVPNYVDTHLFVPGDPVDEDVDVLFVGRLAPQKNVLALLEAVEIAGCNITILGAGPLRETVERFHDRLGARLNILDPVPHSDLVALYNRCRLFVQPSHWEGHPKTLIEAMACGRAVLTSDVPAMREVVSHGETGWVSGTDAPSLATSIKELLAAPELRIRLGRAARNFVETRYALRRIVEKEIGILSGACAKGAM